MPKDASRAEEKRREARTLQLLTPRPSTPLLYARPSASRRPSPRPPLNYQVQPNPPSQYASGSTTYPWTSYQQSPDIYLHSTMPPTVPLPSYGQFQPLPRPMAYYSISDVQQPFWPSNAPFSQPAMYHTEYNQQAPYIQPVNSTMPLMAPVPQYHQSLPLPQAAIDYSIANLREPYEPQHRQFPQRAAHYIDNQPRIQDTAHTTRQPTTITDISYRNTSRRQPALPPQRPPPLVSSDFNNNEVHAQGDVNFYTVGGNLNLSSESSGLLLKLKNILNPVNASYDSYVADQRSSCFKDTRKQLLDDVEEWYSGNGTQSPIYVLDGVAGIGKSTVAQTVAERAAGYGILGASFFFTMNEEERMTAKHFFPTIAFHLARFNRLFAEHLNRAIEQDPDAAQKTIQQQVTLLLIDPLQNSSLPTALPILVVIDALDECREDEACTLLTLLAHHIPRIPQLRLFITARPEQHLRQILTTDRNHKLFHLHEIDDGIVQSDIRLYLEHSLSVERVRAIFPYHEPPWQPSPLEMLMLCGISGTLFIIASTATRFILDTKAADPKGRLSCLLEGVSPEDYSGSNQTDVMDKFYIRIIHNAIPKSSVVNEVDRWFDRYQTIIGAILVLQNPLPCCVLALLLDLHQSDVTKSLLHLHSLVAPSGPDMIFRVHHKSFPDFITNLNRIEHALSNLPMVTSSMALNFLIDTRAHHRRLAAACLHVMSTNLKFNVRNLSPETWFLDRADIINPQDEPLGEELIYAAFHWSSHIHAAVQLDSGFQNNFEEWASTQIMAWLEVMSILGQLSRAHNMLEMALGAVSTQSDIWAERNSIHTLLSDARRFLVQNVEVITLAPMHIYWSALPFIPQNTLLYKTYEKLKNLSVISGIEWEWDSAALVTMTGHSDDVTAVAFSPNGKILASASYDYTIRLWDGNMGAHLVTLEGHSDYVLDVAFSPDGAKLASASSDHTIHLWDVSTGAHFITLEGHSDWVRSVAFSPDGSRLASGSDDRSIRLWDAETGAHLITIEGHSDYVNSVTFSPDGLRLASGSDDRTVRLWDGQTGSYISTYDGHSGGVHSVAFSPDGSRLASASDDHTIRLSEVTTGAHIITLEGHSDAVYSVAFSPDGLRLASGSGDNTVRLWRATTGAAIVTFNSYSSFVNGVAFSPDGSRLASASGDYSSVRLWDLKADSLKGHSNNAGLSLEDSVEPDTPQASNGLDTIRGHSGEVTAMVHSPPDGSRFASTSDGEAVRLWDGTTGAHVTILQGHSSTVRAVAFSPDGSRLALGSQNKTMRLWNGQTDDHICTLYGHSGWVMTVAFSPDGSKLASGSDDKTIQLWDGKTGDYITTLHGHSDWIRAVAFSPDGLRLVSASHDRTLRVWDGQSGSHISTINSDVAMAAIAFSPGGSTLASIKEQIYVHDVIDNVYLRTVNNVVRPISLSQFFESITSFAFLPSVEHPMSLPAITTTNDVIDPLFTHPVTPDYPLRIITLGERRNPSLSGLVYLKVPADGEPVMVPFCWFPPHFKVTAFSVDSAGSSIAVGCRNGRIILLDISKVSLP